ncbi:MAG: DUF4407 domain-containing protein [Flavobacteriales bacterium]|nr:DUF4407 domain-containing protein [Flavobacteriales bacterium]
MLKLFALLTNSPLAQLRAHGPVSINKVVAMGMGLLGVTLFWTAISFGIAYHLFECGVLGSLGAALFAGGFVFTIDRIIILGKGKDRLMAGVRIGLSVIIALLGGVCLDLLLLKSEVEQELVAIHQDQVTHAMDRITDRHSAELDQARERVEHAHEEAVLAESRYVAEINGSPSGSGRYGVGQVAREKGRLLRQRQEELAREQQQLTLLETQVGQEREFEKATLQERQAAPTLFQRIHAMHRYLVKDWMVLVAYLMLTLAVMVFELTPLIVKYRTPTTSFEAEVEAVDRLKHARVASLIARQEQLMGFNTGMTLGERRAMRVLNEVEKDNDQAA